VAAAAELVPEPVAARVPGQAAVLVQEPEVAEQAATVTEPMVVMEVPAVLRVLELVVAVWAPEQVVPVLGRSHKIRIRHRPIPRHRLNCILSYKTMCKPRLTFKPTPKPRYKPRLKQSM
jgi:hypothetical protein